MRALATWALYLALLAAPGAAYAGAQVYERELVDLFGAQVEGLPPGNRYPLTDDWPTDEHPLRKDWKPIA